MKIKSSSDGGVVIHFTESEIQEMLKAMQSPVLFDEPVERPKSVNINKSLVKKTREFIEELRQSFGTDWFDVSCDVCQHIRKKHFILDMPQVFKRLEKLEAVTIQRDKFAHMTAVKFRF